MRRATSGPPRRGFTPIELLVAVAVIAILIGLMLPAVQKVREAAARSQSTNNLKQLVLGMHNAQDAIGYLPNAGVVGYASPNNRNPGPWSYMLLPYIEQGAYYTAYAAVNANGTTEPTAALQVAIKVYLEPSRGRAGIATAGTGKGPMTDYALNVNALADNGKSVGGGAALAAKVKLRLEQIPDGTSNTVLIGTKSVARSNYQNKDGTPGALEDESILYGGGAGTSRSLAAGYATDPAETPIADNFGAPYATGAPLAFADGHVSMIAYAKNESEKGNDCKTAGKSNPFAQMLSGFDGLPPPQE